MVFKIKLLAKVQVWCILVAFYVALYQRHVSATYLENFRHLQYPSEYYTIKGYSRKLDTLNSDHSARILTTSTSEISDWFAIWNNQSAGIVANPQYIEATSTRGVSDVIIKDVTLTLPASFRVDANSNRPEWLSATVPTTAGLVMNVTIQINATTLRNGVHQGAVYFMIANADTEPFGGELQRVPIAVRLHRSTPILQVFPHDIDQTVAPGRNATVYVTISNVGDAGSDISVRTDYLSLGWMWLETMNCVIQPLNKTDDNSNIPASFTLVGSEYIFYNLSTQHVLRLAYKLSSISMPSSIAHANIYVKSVGSQSSDDDAVVPLIARVSYLQACPASIQSSIAPNEFINLPLSIINLHTQRTLAVADGESMPSWLQMPVAPSEVEAGAPAPLVLASRYARGNFNATGDVYSCQIKLNSTLLDAYDVSTGADFVRGLDVNLSTIPGVPVAFVSALTVANITIPINQRVKIQVHLRDAFGNYVSDASLRLKNWPNVGSRLRITVKNADFSLPSPSLDWNGNGIVTFSILPEYLGLMQVGVSLQDDTGIWDPILGSPSLLTVAAASCGGTQQRTSDDTSCVCRSGYSYDAVRRICDPCRSGMYRPLPGKYTACLQCTPGTFSAEASSGCNTCPQIGAVCTDGIIRMLPGYWREPQYNVSNLNGDVFIHTCPRQSACQIDQQTQNIVCATGHTGPRCAVCTGNYQPHGVVCQLCHMGSSVLALICSISFVLLAVLILRRSSTADQEAAGIFRIFVSWAQVTALVGTLVVNTSDESRTAMSLGSIVSGFYLDFQPIRCLLDLNLFQRVYLYVALPLIVILICIGIGWFYHAIDATRNGRTNMVCCPCFAKYRSDVRVALQEAKRQEDMDVSNGFGIHEMAHRTQKPSAALRHLRAWQGVVRQIKGSASVVLYLVYFPVLIGMVSAWDVYPHQIYGNTYFNQDFTLTTSNAQYTLVLALSILAIITYALGLPLIAFRGIWRHRFTLTLPRIHVAWGFLYDGCRLTDARFLWEFFVLLRKLALVVVAVLVKDAILQATAVFYLLAISVVIHLAVKPYKSNVMHALEAIGLIVHGGTTMAFVAIWASDSTSASNGQVAGEMQGSIIGTAIILLANTSVAIIMILAFFVSLSVRFRNITGHLRASVRAWIYHNIVSACCKHSYRQYLKEARRRRRAEAKFDDETYDDKFTANPLSRGGSSVANNPMRSINSMRNSSNGRVESTETKALPSQVNQLQKLNTLKTNGIRKAGMAKPKTSNLSTFNTGSNPLRKAATASQKTPAINNPLSNEMSQPNKQSMYPSLDSSMSIQTNIRNSNGSISSSASTEATPSAQNVVGLNNSNQVKDTTTSSPLASNPMNRRQSLATTRRASAVGARQSIVNKFTFEGSDED